MKCQHIIFLLILLSVSLFLAGFRLGKKVERFDKTYLPLLTPTTTPLPTPTPQSIKFNTFLSVDCGLKFLYPSFFKEEKNSSDEGKLIYNKEKIIIDCSKIGLERFIKEKDDLKKDKEMTILNQKITLYQSKSENHLVFVLSNWQNGKRIVITTSKNLLNLIEETLKFL